MTRDDHRAKCIKTMHNAYIRNSHLSSMAEIFTRILDSLPSAGARVVPIEATREMMGSGQSEAEEGASLGRIFAAMSAAGDLTNPPETKP